jgi:hypothetical protein
MQPRARREFRLGQEAGQAAPDRAGVLTPGTTRPTSGMT